MSHAPNNATTGTTTAGPLQALLVEFDSPGALISAAERVRDAGYTRWDTHSPFPVHGIDQAMGIRPTRLPWIVFVFGVCGCLAGLILQWWTNATGAATFPFVPTFLQGYNFPISGKPEFSLPANIPVIFETTVLLAALAAVFGMLAMNNLPRHHQPIFSSERFRRVTADRFFVCVDAADPRFSELTTPALLEGLPGALGVERIHDAPSPSRLPRVFAIVAVTLAVLALFPPLLIVKERMFTSPLPRVHPIQDMDNQERFGAQQANPLFADGRAARSPIDNTLARGDWPTDVHFVQGRPPGWKPGDDVNAWARVYPPQVEVSVPLIRDVGRVHFNVYCAPCHGLGGAGDGPVAQRAAELETLGWVTPTSLVDPLIQERSHGSIYNTIRNGLRTMPPYGDQIRPADRWAIVMYVRALQYSQNATIEDIPESRRDDLK